MFSATQIAIWKHSNKSDFALTVQINTHLCTLYARRVHKHVFTFNSIFPLYFFLCSKRLGRCCAALPPCLICCYLSVAIVAITDKKMKMKNSKATLRARISLSLSSLIHPFLLFSFALALSATPSLCLSAGNATLLLLLLLLSLSMPLSEFRALLFLCSHWPSFNRKCLRRR